ncbi:MAG TPA: hypothetical protein VKC60_12865 [Opitutaceae bacterium]|nr:hypothetical protein [Opitutaceae bacterium]
MTKLLAENFENLNDLRVQRRASGAFSLVFVVKNTGRSFVEFTPVLRLSPSARSDLTLPEMYCHGGKTQFFIMSLYDGQDGVDIKNDPELVATKGLVVK